MSGRLEGKVALVTGAGSGIGKETALRFAAEGARVAAADLKGDTARATAAEIGGDALGLELNVTSAASIAAGLDALLAHFGGIDVVVNNAGVTIVGSIMDLDEELWDRELDTNLKSIFLVSRAAWRHLVARGGGCILVTASVCATHALQNDAAYCASKAGAAMLTQCMALDGAKVGIRANCVLPGFIDTPMIHGYFNDQPDPEASRQGAEAMHPLGRLGSPRDIADAFVYLASDDARWVTGTRLVVDGGLTTGLWGG
jgi:NAD(P)-dependent dehydrogenase (short-subunit alcohol dehydrogenase family)